uniref:BRCT domain-containing protein n=1 Tax=Pyxicephalus adspersus TaxID=30357 RepID=A0AAV3A6X8_PYXAD|nr:TPA: hypothetical protein GDO54_013265 [Pyxicephalus adspersus]
MLDKRKRITFKGKLFYLDLAHIKQTQHLTKAICSLGGVIEGFLSRDVNYVVTDSRKALDIANGSSVASKRGGHSKRQASSVSWEAVIEESYSKPGMFSYKIRECHCVFAFQFASVYFWEEVGWEG